MSKGITGSGSESRPEWEQLEDWVRGQVQRLIQELLEEEVTEFLGRAKSARRSESDSDAGYRNGYAKPRRLTLSSGTIQLRRPRVRDTEEEFESRLPPLFVHRSRKVSELIPELYLHGLSKGDFDLAVRGLLGEEAPVSASTGARLKDKWNAELAEWHARSLDDLEVVYMWVDGVYVKAGLEKEKAAILVVMAALSDGRKVVVSSVPGYRESTESWSEVLRDMKRRGLECPRLVIGDGHLGIWGALRNVYPQAAEQRCWNHKMMNVLDKLPKRQQGEAKLMLRAIPYAETRADAERLRTAFSKWCRDRSYDAASETRPSRTPGHPAPISPAAWVCPLPWIAVPCWACRLCSFSSLSAPSTFESRMNWRVSFLGLCHLNLNHASRLHPSLPANWAPLPHTRTSDRNSLVRSCCVLLKNSYGVPSSMILLSSNMIIRSATSFGEPDFVGDYYHGLPRGCQFSHDVQNLFDHLRV